MHAVGTLRPIEEKNASSVIEFGSGHRVASMKLAVADLDNIVSESTGHGTSHRELFLFAPSRGPENSLCKYCKPEA